MTYEHKPRPQPAVSEPLLLDPKPTASAPADVKIAHVQLRDLIVCPHNRGGVWYVGPSCIIEHDILDPFARPRILAHLTFTPVTLTTLSLPENRILLAAGGQDRELFLALYHAPNSYDTCNASSPSPHPSSSRSSTLHGQVSASSETPGNEVDWDMDSNTQEPGKRARELLGMRRRRRDDDQDRHSREIWQHSSQFEYPASINNSVILYLPPASQSHDLKGVCTPSSISPSSDEMLPRLIVSNNDQSIKFLVISLTKGGFGKRRRDGWLGHTEERQYETVGALKLPVPVNHTSVSPDGSTLLSCGDSSSIYLHRIISKPSSSTHPHSPTFVLVFEPLITLCLPPSPSYPLSQVNPYLPFAYIDGAWTVSGAPVSSCFATAWNKDGSKFAVASQEGMVLVWDVRSGEPLEGAQWETVRVEDADEKDKGSSDSRTGLNGTWIRDAAGDLMRDGGIDVDDLAVWYANHGDAPSWGVRVLKFARNASGKEVLVFTEHASNVHVIDADTFSIHDVIRIPHVPLRKPTPPSPSPPSLHIEDVSSPSTTRDHDYPNQSYVRSGRDLLSSFNRDQIQGHGSSSARVGGYINPRGHMTGAIRPMAAGGPRHTTPIRAPSRVLNSNLPFSRSPEMMPHEQSPRRRSITLPPNAPRPPWFSGIHGALNVLPPPPPRRRRHIPAIPPGGLTTRRSSFESNRPPGRDVRERMAAEMRDMGDNIDDALMEEDIAWNMILDAIERDDVEMATEQERDSQRDNQAVQAALESARVNATERLREVLIGQPIPHSFSPRRNVAPRNQILPTDAERAEARFFSYLESMGLRIDNASNSIVRSSGNSDANTSAGAIGEEIPGPDDWDYECTTPPPLFSTDLTRAVSAGEIGSGSSTDTDISDALSPDDLNVSQTVLPSTQSLAQHLPDATPAHSERSSPRAALPPFRELIEVTDGRRLDIAGACFDPTGAYMYVATVDGITEWKVKGSELRWWGGGAFL